MKRQKIHDRSRHQTAPSAGKFRAFTREGRQNTTMEDLMDKLEPRPLDLTPQPWRMAVDRAAEVVYCYQLDVRAEMPTIRRAIRVREEQTGQKWSLVPSVFVQQRKLDASYVQTVLGRNSVMGVADLTRLMEHMTVGAGDFVDDAAEEDVRFQESGTTAGVVDLFEMDSEEKPDSPPSANGLAIPPNEINTDFGPEIPWRKQDKRSWEPPQSPSPVHPASDDEESEEKSSTGSEYKPNVYRGRRINRGKSSLPRRRFKPGTSNAICKEEEGSDEHLQSRRLKRLSAHLGPRPERSTEQKLMLDEIRKAYQTAGPDKTEIFPNSNRFVDRYRFDALKERLHKSPKYDAVDLAVLVAGGKENSLKLFTGDGFGLNAAIDRDAIMAIVYYINHNHPEVVKKRQLPVTSDELVKGFSRKMAYLRKYHGSADDAEEDAAAQGEDDDAAESVEAEHHPSTLFPN
ncbi:hypothetical protein BV898_15414 [Hypsibius exemplaris]|uniref:Uncharacterized protein n=1 Tax=Hypsibius exemplaris TaxID=2072580 RepID=A0A9X6RK62_HYPEX|nr:hypothetical protein BV898_15414 [Hypsibius exemplaris]